MDDDRPGYMSEGDAGDVLSMGDRCTSTYNGATCEMKAGHCIDGYHTDGSVWHRGDGQEWPSGLCAGERLKEIMAEADRGAKVLLEQFQVGDRCAATFGDEQCGLDKGHGLRHHAHSSVWWWEGQTPATDPVDMPNDWDARADARQACADVVQGSSIGPDTITRRQWEERYGTGRTFLREETGQLVAAYGSLANMRTRPMGNAEAILEAVEDVKPAGVRLVAVVVNGIPNVPRWWWRWVEPVALWLLKRAGFEVCR